MWLSITGSRFSGFAPPKKNNLAMKCAGKDLYIRNSRIMLIILVHGQVFLPFKSPGANVAFESGRHTAFKP